MHFMEEQLGESFVGYIKRRLPVLIGEILTLAAASPEWQVRCWCPVLIVDQTVLTVLKEQCTPAAASASASAWCVIGWHDILARACTGPL